MNLHCTFLGGQVLNFWGISPSEISQEGSSHQRQRGWAVGTLQACSSALCWFGGEPRPAKPKGWHWHLCCCLHSSVSTWWMRTCWASCFATCKDRWKTLKSAKHWPNPASADVSGDFCVDLESRFSENAKLVFTLLPRVKWSVCLSAGWPAAVPQLPSALCRGQPQEE